MLTRSSMVSACLAEQVTMLRNVMLGVLHARASAAAAAASMRPSLRHAPSWGDIFSDGDSDGEGDSLQSAVDLPAPARWDI